MISDPLLHIIFNACVHFGESESTCTHALKSVTMNLKSRVLQFMHACTTIYDNESETSVSTVQLT
jgi:hypothetical protein